MRSYTRAVNNSGRACTTTTTTTVEYVEESYLASGAKKRKASKCVHPIEPPLPSTMAFTLSGHTQKPQVSRRDVLCAQFDNASGNTVNNIRTAEARVVSWPEFVSAAKAHHTRRDANDGESCMFCAEIHLRSVIAHHPGYRRMLDHVAWGKNCDTSDNTVATCETERRYNSVTRSARFLWERKCRSGDVGRASGTGTPQELIQRGSVRCLTTSCETRRGNAWCMLRPSSADPGGR